MRRWRNPFKKKKLAIRQVIDQLLLQQPDRLGDGDWLIKVLMRNENAKVVAELKDELLKIEVGALAQKDSLKALRIAIMDAVDAASLNKHLLEMGGDRKAQLSKLYPDWTDDKLAWQYAYAEFQIKCLRLYCLANYGDGAANDWFVFYVKAAEINVSFQTAMLLADASSVAPVLVKPYEEAMRNVRATALEAPVGKSIPAATMINADQPAP